MPRKNNKNVNAIEVYGADVKTSYLRSQVAKMIMDGQNKNDIINWLMEEYKMPFKNAVSAHRQGYVFLFLTCEQTKEEITQLSLARLEELYQMAEKDGMLKGKDYYNVQMRNIDMVNKTAGVYDKEDQSENNTDINFNLNIGANKPVETKIEEIEEDEV